MLSPSGTGASATTHPQNCGGVPGSSDELMPSHVALLTVTLPTESSLIVQMLS